MVTQPVEIVSGFGEAGQDCAGDSTNTDTANVEEDDFGLLVSFHLGVYNLQYLIYWEIFQACAVHCERRDQSVLYAGEKELVGLLCSSGLNGEYGVSPDQALLYPQPR